MSNAKLIICSIFSGMVITVALTWIAFSIDNKKLTRVLLWQDTLLVHLVGPGPLLHIDAEGKPHYEATPIHTIILPIGFLLGVPIYSGVSYLVLRSFSNRGGRPKDGD